MGRCRRRCNSIFTSFSLACHLERIVCRSTVNRPFRVFAQLCVKPRKLKVSGFPSPRPRRFRSACPTELDEARLVGMQRQAEPREAFAQVDEEAFGFLPMLKSHDEIIGKT